MTDLLRRRRKPGLAALAALAVVLVAAVYVTGRGAVKSGGACAASTAARRLAPLARGPLAAVVVADSPQDVSGLAFAAAGGAPKRIADFAGRPLLVNLWATWCAPCRAEMPALDRLARARGERGPTVVAVNVDTGDAEKPSRFLREIGATALADYRDPKMALYGEVKGLGLAFGLPTTLIVDARGCEIAALNGPADWDRPAAAAFLDAVVAE